MAMKPLRPCLKPGCGMLTRDGYCPAHRPQYERKAAPWRRWYSLPVWTDDLRPGQLLREPFCRECAKRGIRTRATDVDHVVSHNGNWALFTDRANLQSLCHSCHSQKTLREMREKRQEF